MSAERPGEWPLTHEEVVIWTRRQEWRFAKTMKDNPHSYCLKRATDSQRMFELVVLHIREFGYHQTWWGGHFTMYEADGHHLWSMGAPLECTILINRKAQAQVDEDKRTGKGR